MIDNQDLLFVLAKIGESRQQQQRKWSNYGGAGGGSSNGIHRNHQQSAAANHHSHLARSVRMLQPPFGGHFTPQMSLAHRSGAGGGGGHHMQLMPTMQIVDAQDQESDIESKSRWTRASSYLRNRTAKLLMRFRITSSPTNNQQPQTTQLPQPFGPHTNRPILEQGRRPSKR